jgi:hypothetical protein
MASIPRRMNAFWLVLLALLMVAASLLVFVKLLESTVGGPVGFFTWLSSPQTPPRIAILKSDFTVQAHDALHFDGSGKAWRDSTVAKWQQVLHQRQLEPYPLTDDNVENGELLDPKGKPKYNILILPSVRAMSDLEIERISDYLKKGGNVLGSWALGIYRPDGKWRGWRLMEENFGVKFSHFVEQGTGSHKISQQVFAGNMKRGLYLPEDKVDSQIYSTTIKASDGALSGYVWVADKPLGPLTSDYALVDTTSSAPNRSGVSITFYQWIGGNPDAPNIKPSLNEAVRNFTLRGQTPLTIDIPAGYRMRVGTYDRPIMVTPTDVRTQVAGFWYDYTLEDKSLPEAAIQSAGLVYGTNGEGRFVYMGHELVAMGAKDASRLGLDLEDQTCLDHFFTNVLAWLNHQPVAYASSFPMGYDAAAMVGVATDHDFSTLTEYQRLLTDMNIKGSYFVGADLVAGNEDWIKRFQLQGDVGVMAQTASEASRGSQSLAKQLGQAPKGLFSTHTFSASALEQLQGNGFRYVVTDSVERRSMPQPFESSKIIAIRKAGRSDDDAYLRGVRDALGLQAVFFQDAERVRYEGGAYPMMLFSSNLKSIEALNGVRNTLEQLKSKHFWLTSGRELAEWAAGRAGIHTASRKTSAERTVVQISNDSDQALDHLALYIYLDKPYNPAKEQIVIRPETVQLKNMWGYLTGKKTMGVAEGKDFKVVDAARSILCLTIQRLDAHQDMTYQIDVKPKQAKR